MFTTYNALEVTGDRWFLLCKLSSHPITEQTFHTYHSACRWPRHSWYTRPCWGQRQTASRSRSTVDKTPHTSSPHRATRSYSQSLKNITPHTDSILGSTGRSFCSGKGENGEICVSVRVRQKGEGKLTDRPQEEIKEGAKISNSTRHSCGLTFSHLTWMIWVLKCQTEQRAPGIHTESLQKPI